jgi:hypothetical protein
VDRRRRVGKRKPKAEPPKAPLTRKVRRLIDLAYDGNIRLASQVTKLPYATLRDLYTGTTLNPGLATIKALAIRHGFPEVWFLKDDYDDEIPVGGWQVPLPPAPSQLSGPREERRILVPYASWPLIEVYGLLSRHLDNLPESESRPIIGTAKGSEITRRIARFVFGPLLEAEKLGEQVIFQPDPPEHLAQWLQTPETHSWLKTLQALGWFWERAIPKLLAQARENPR